MSFDKSAKKNVAGIVVVVILLAIAITISVRPSGDRVAAGSIQSWYYDLQTGELFTAEPQGMQPVNTPSGGIGMGVIAHVFSCSACAPDDRIVLAIESLSDEAKAVQVKLQANPASVPPQVLAQTMATGQVIAAPPEAGGEPKWVAKSSPAGYALIDQADTLCDGIPADRCRP